MILTRLVRIQLVLFMIAAIVGVTVMLLNYVQIRTLLGLGKLDVKMELAETGSLYRFSNVTYRGVQIGKVTDIAVRRGGVVVTMRLDTSPRIPADIEANVRSVSAVGEQYVDLRPRGDGPPYLTDGSVIHSSATSTPEPVGPMLDKLSAMIGSVPSERVSLLLDESFKAFNGAGDDMASLLDSASAISASAKDTAPRTRTLIEDSAPLLDTQVQTVDSIRTWARSLAGVTGQLVDNDPQIRTLLDTGPGSLQQLSSLMEQVKPTLPVLLANLTSVGQVGVTYHPSLETLLVLLPPLIAVEQAIGGPNNPDNLTPADFRLLSADPIPCTAGFLPPSEWRPPDEIDTPDTPKDMYCKLPQDSPIAVRGARNLPCMGVPGKRAPTVEICYSDKEYAPLVQRQHATGPYPFDPNLVAQGIPLDNRVERKIFLPPGTETPPIPAPAEAVAAEVQPQPAPVPGFGIVEYDPATGNYVGPDGKLYQQSDMARGQADRSWQDLLVPPPGS